MRDAVVSATEALNASNTAVDTSSEAYSYYTSALSQATEAEVRLAISMIERMNVMGAMDPMMAAARDRLEALKLEAEAADAAYQSAFRDKKESGFEGGGNGYTAPGGATSQQPGSSTRDLSEAQAILSSMDRTTLSLHTHLTQISDDMAPISSDFAASADRMAEAARAASEQAMLDWEAEMQAREERGEAYIQNVFGGAFDTMLDDMDKLDDYFLNIIKGWAVEYAAIFAKNVITSAIPGIGGVLGGFL